MAEEKSAGVKGTLAGWIKAGITTIFGLMSGACLMYLTPLINNTIKPAKPLANFATQVSGLTVTFNNHSTGGGQGWWDFGDGTALVPFTPKDATTSHTYAKPGTYSVKLSLQNLLGEESDRSVAINVDAAVAATMPAIEEFEATAIADDRVPATFKLTSKIKNATCCVLVRGDDRPLQLDVDAMNQDRYVVFEKSGTYTLRLAAVNGKEIVEKTKTISVRVGEAGDALAKLHVSYEAVKIKRDERHIPVQCVWNRDPNDSVCPFREERPVNHGYVITAAELVNKDDGAVQKVKLEVSPDKSRVILTGELVKPRSLLPAQTTPTWLADIKVKMERRSPPMVINRGDVVMAVRLNATMRLPIQPLEDGWEVIKQRVNLEILEGQRKVWESGQAVTGAKVTLKNQACTVTMSPQKNTMLLKVESTSAPTVAIPTPPAGTPTVVTPTPPAGTPTVLTPTPPAPLVVPSVVRPARFDRLPGLPMPK